MDQIKGMAAFNDESTKIENISDSAPRYIFLMLTYFLYDPKINF